VAARSRSLNPDVTAAIVCCCWLLQEWASLRSVRTEIDQVVGTLGNGTAAAAQRCSGRKRGISAAARSTFSLFTLMGQRRILTFQQHDYRMIRRVAGPSERSADG
jgi:hypothetical protein